MNTDERRYEKGELHRRGAEVAEVRSKSGAPPRSLRLCGEYSPYLCSSVVSTSAFIFVRRIRFRRAKADSLARYRL